MELKLSIRTIILMILVILILIHNLIENQIAKINNYNTLDAYIIAVINTNSKEGNIFSMNPCAAKGKNEFNPKPIMPDNIIINISET